MAKPTPLISTDVVALVLAFVRGATASRLRISPVAGYLLAGVTIGPFTPGFVASQSIATPTRVINAAAPIIARSHSDAETAHRKSHVKSHVKSHGATKVTMGEEEIALAMLAEMSKP